MRYYLSILFYITLFLCLSCEKGEVENNYTPFTTLFIENYESSYKLEIDGHKYGSGSIKVPALDGENAIKLYNGDDELQFEGSFKLKLDRDTLVFFKINEDIPVSLMRKEELNEPREEGKLKLKIINVNQEISQLVNEKPFHLVFYQQMAKKVRPPQTITYHEVGDTVKNITSMIPSEYEIIDITDNQESSFGFTGRAQILQEDFTPLLSEDKEVFIEYQNLDGGGSNGVIIALIPNDVIRREINTYSNLPHYWQYGFNFSAFQVVFGN